MVGSDVRNGMEIDQDEPERFLADGLVGWRVAWEDWSAGFHWEKKMNTLRKELNMERLVKRRGE